VNPKNIKTNNQVTLR